MKAPKSRSEASDEVRRGLAAVGFVIGQVLAAGGEQARAIAVLRTSAAASQKMGQMEQVAQVRGAAPPNREWNGEGSKGTPMTTLVLVLAGADVAQAAEAIEQVFANEATIKRSVPAALPELQRKAIDPISLAALILSVPGAALAAMDLADRIAKRKRAKALIEAAERVKVEKKVETYVVTIEGPKALADLSPDDLLALAARGDPAV